MLKTEHDRIQAIDFIKGIDIVLMVLFNYSITLDYFNLIRIPSGFLYHFILPASIASVFIFMSGVIAHVIYEKNKEKLTRKYFIRGTKLLFFAMLITLFTYIFVPRYTVFFGILHFFAIASFLIPVFIKYKKIDLGAGFLFLITGFYLLQQRFGFSYFMWLGLVPENLSTFDYFPLLPWLGVVLLGIHYGCSVAGKLSNINLGGGFSNVFTFLGKHSLTVYLIHQPLLILLLMISGFRL